MLGLGGFKLYGAIGLAVIAALFVAWAFRANHLRAYWHDRYDTETVQVTAQIANAVGNPKLKWKDVGAQVDAYAKGHDALIVATSEANARIEAMGAESDRLKRFNAELRAKADIAIAARAKAIDRLEQSALTPGDRADCQAQIAAAQSALDAVYEEGL